MRDRYASLREGLVGAWIPSVSGSGLLLPDVSGQGNNGALTNMGPEDWVAGEHGRALDFDGTNDVVVCDFPYIEPPFSISCWVKLDTTTVSGTMVALADSTVSDQQYRLWFGDAGYGYVWSADAFNTSYNIASIARKTGASVGTWYNVVGIWDQSNLRKIFIDTAQGTDSTLSVTNPTGINRIGFGVTVDTTPTNYLNGQLDDIRIYNRALSEPEIKLLSQEPGVGFKRTRSVFDFGRKPAYLPPTPTDYRTVRVKQTEHASLREGLVGAWCPSIEGSGYTLPDLSGQGNNGALTNMGPEDWVSSQYGRALDFDGSNDTAQVSFNRLGFQQATISFFALVRNTGTMLFVQVGGLGGVFLSRITTGKLLAFFDGTTANNTSSDESNTTIAANRWYHIAATNDGSTTRYFINGILDKSYSDTILQNTGTVVWIGSNANTQQFVNGQLDDIRIYNRALPESEIKLLASRPGIGLRPQRRTMYYAPPTGARRRRILTSMP